MAISQGKAGETLLIHVPNQTNTRVLLVGAGKRSGIKTGDYTRIARALASAVNKLAVRSAIIDVNEVSVAGKTRHGPYAARPVPC